MSVITDLINKRNFTSALIPLSVAPVIACFGSGSGEGPQTTNQPPNVLLIAIDDMRDWVGYLDGYEGTVHTPNIDRLAEQGVGFTNAHVASPQCCPSRNAFMLGKRSSTTGLYGNDVWWKPALPDIVTLPQYFKMNGYHTVGAGKIFHHTPGNNPPVSWHDFQDQVLDDPWNFATWDPERYWLDYGYRAPIMELPPWKPLNGLKNLPTQVDWGPIPGLAEIEYGDNRVVDYGREFLCKKHDKPFFLALGMYRPHIPWHVPQKYFDMYPLDEIVMPVIKEDDLNDVPEEGLRLIRRGNRELGIIREGGKYEEVVQAYLACITFADDMVGYILDALEKSAYHDNTIVVLWSDHGYHLGSKNTLHKWTLWEEVTRVPFIIKAPDMAGNGFQCHQPVDMLNVYPTLISLCGLPPKEGLDGYDMSLLLHNPDADWEWPAITEYRYGQVAVRTMDWRYIRYSDMTEELYNRDEDPREWYNLAGDEKYEHILEKHRKWIPASFAEPAIKREEWYFDPYANTYTHRKTGEFVDGNR